MSLLWHWGAQHSSCQQNTHEDINEMSGPIKIYFDDKSGICLFVDSGSLAGLVLGVEFGVAAELFTH